MFTLTTPNGSAFEIDPEKVESFDFGINGVVYRITVEKL